MKMITLDVIHSSLSLIILELIRRTEAHVMRMCQDDNFRHTVFQQRQKTKNNNKQKAEATLSHT